MKAKVNVIVAMLMFGSIGLFVRGIALPSSVIALVRGVIGCLFLVTAGCLMKQPVNWRAIKGNWLVLVLSGAGSGYMLTNRVLGADREAFWSFVQSKVEQNR